MRHYQRLRDMVAAKPFGDLLEIRIFEGGRTTRQGDYGRYQDESVAAGGGIIKDLGCHSLDLAFWTTGALGFQVLSRRVEWDGDTDRRASARVRLQGLNGISGADCDLVWTLSWLDHQPNTMEFQFEHATLRSPVSPADRLDLISREGKQLAMIDARASGGARTFAQAFYLEWDTVLKGVKARSETAMSAATSTQAAELMDELLSR